MGYCIVGMVMETSTPLPNSHVSSFMRPFVLVGTVFLTMQNILFMATHGAISSPDRWSDVYLLILVAYAGGAEITQLLKRKDSDEIGWQEQIRKGGPLVTLWLGMLLAAGIWRMADPACSMPPELKETAIKVVGVFFGSYTLRQYRRARQPRSEAATGAANILLDADAARLMEELRRQNSQTPKALSDATGIPRRSVARLLKNLVQSGALVRHGGPFDPSATYGLKP